MENSSAAWIAGIKKPAYHKDGRLKEKDYACQKLYNCADDEPNTSIRWNLSILLAAWAT
jgi:hypothetical protein